MQILIEISLEDCCIYIIAVLPFLQQSHIYNVFFFFSLAGIWVYDSYLRNIQQKPDWVRMLTLDHDLHNLYAIEVRKRKVMKKC